MCREGMAQRMRRGAVRQSERATQPFHGQLNDARCQRPAARADEHRLLGRKRMRALGDIILHGVEHAMQHRDHPRLVAFARHRDDIAAHRLGNVTPVAHERLGNAQASTPPRRQYRHRPAGSSRSRASVSACRLTYIYKWRRDSLAGFCGNADIPKDGGRRAVAILTPGRLSFVKSPRRKALMPRRVVDVLVPVALNQTYSYTVPDDVDLVVGDVVTAPLAAREVTAVGWGENPNPDPRLHNRLKDVSGKLDVPPLREELRRFVDWVSSYTLASRGMVMRMTLRMGEHLGPERERLGVRLVGDPPKRMTAARARLLDLLSDGLLRAKSEAAQEAGVSPSVIDGLVDEGTLVVEPLPREKPQQPPDPSFAEPDVSPEQSEAAAKMRELAAQDGFAVALIDGGTGSGKTEVYFEAVGEVIRKGRQALILMPEIALTGQFLERFAQRFGVRPIEWHSALTPRTRARNWLAVVF